MRASAPRRSPLDPLPLSAADAARGMRWLYTLVLLWLAGAAMRLTVLAVPPVLPQMQRGLAMSQTDIGVLSSLPSLLFAIVAIPGAALVARFGALPTLIGGLVVAAAGGAVRGLAPDTLILFATTFAMSAGIAVMQPALPRIVRDWAPRRVGFATAVYANGMLASEALAASLTIPFVLPLAGGSWRWSLAFWSLPVVLIGWLLAAEGARRRAIAEPAPAAIRGPQRWWPDWRDPLTWEIGLAMGCASGIYFGVNAFLPGYLIGSGRGGSVDGALAAINITQIPATVILFFCAQRLSVKRIPYVATGIAAAAGVIGLVMMPGAWALAWSALIGFCCAAVITLALTLPPLLSRPDDVHRLAGAAFTIGYAWAVVIPILGGLAWDLTGTPVAAFAPAAACGIIVAVVGASFRFRGMNPP